MSLKLRALNPSQVLRGALDELRKSAPKWRRRLLWVAVAEVCLVGAATAKAICREEGWNPDAKLEDAELLTKQGTTWPAARSDAP